MRARVLLAGLLVLAGCERSRPAPSETWLTGGVEERFGEVARQLRGLDVAMIEIGYRYGELYFAGRDENWAYAGYQAEKIGTALQSALRRRPRRVASSRAFEPALRDVAESIRARDAAGFARRFAALTAACTGCHLVEGMASLMVAPPRIRLAPVVGGAGPSKE
jgi:hypothetical protein